MRVQAGSLGCSVAADPDPGQGSGFGEALGTAPGKYQHRGGG